MHACTVRLWQFFVVICATFCGQFYARLFFNILIWGDSLEGFKSYGGRRFVAPTVDATSKQRVACISLRHL